MNPEFEPGDKGHWPPSQPFKMTPTELFLSVAAILAFSVIFIRLINAAERAADTRNARRWADVNAILNAVLIYETDAQTEFSGTAEAPVLRHPVYVQVIVNNAEGVKCDLFGRHPICPGRPMYFGPGKKCVADLSGLVPRYLPRIGLNPSGIGYLPDEELLDLGPHNTGYYIQRSVDGKLTVGSCFTDRDAVIKLSR